jgi:hypothetical protein
MLFSSCLLIFLCSKSSFWFKIPCESKVLLTFCLSFLDPGYKTRPTVVGVSVSSLSFLPSVYRLGLLYSELGSFLCAGRIFLISSCLKIMADGYVCLFFLCLFTTTLGLMVLVCVIVLNLSTFMITFCGLGHCPLNKDFKECWRNPIVFLDSQVCC